MSKATPQSSSADASARMRATRRRDTAAEVQLRRALHRLGARYRVDFPPLAGIRRRADVVFTRAKVAVFVDGCFWHGCPQHATWPKANADWWRNKIETNQRRDRDTDERLREAGWVTLRIWEHEDMGPAAERVQALVADRQRR